MDSLALGVLFAMLDIAMPIGGHEIGLLPSPLGYYLIFQGCVKMADYSRYFGKIRMPAIVMCVITGLIYVAKLFGFSGGFGFVFSLLSLAGNIYVTYLLVQSVRDMESFNQCDLNGKMLWYVWLAVIAVRCLSLFLGIVPILSTILMVAEYAVTIVFVLSFYRSKTLFHKEEASE